jgi:hypothetical protein
MAAKKKAPADKYVDPLYSRNSGNSPIPSMPWSIETLPTRTRGAGDPNYSKKMKTGKGKPLPKK